MRGGGFLLGVVCVALAVAACAENPDVQDLRANLHLDPKEIDFGVVYLGDRPVASVTIRNRGSGSTTIEFDDPPEGITVRPRKLAIAGRTTDHLKVEFVPRAEMELDTKLVFRDGDEAREIPLRARALKGPVSFPEVLDFGRVRIGGDETLALSLENRLDEDLAIHLRANSSATASRYAFPHEEFTVAARSKVEVPVTFSPTGEGGRQDGTIAIRCTDCPPMEVILLGEGDPVDLDFDPYPVVFAAVSPEGSEELAVRVDNVGRVFSGELRLEMEKGTRFSVRPERLPGLAPGESGVFFVRYDAPEDALTETAELRVFTGSVRVATVPVTAKVVGTELVVEGPPEMPVAPVNWPGGQPYVWRIEVTNVGTTENVPLTVTLQGPDADAFSVEPIGDGIAEPGKPEPYRLHFLPRREGEHTVIVEFEGDGRRRALPIAAWGSLPNARCAAMDPVVQVARAITLRGWDASPHPQSRCSWAVRSAPTGFARGPDAPNSCTTGFLPTLVGDYEVELILEDDAGNLSTCVQAFEARPFQALWVELFWEKPSDVDLYLFNDDLGDPSIPEHWLSIAACYFANCRESHDPLQWGDQPGNRPLLDVDDIHGTGPENITIVEVPIFSRYHFGVHWFDQRGQSSTEATVNVYCNGEHRGNQSLLLNKNKIFYRLGTIQFNEDLDCTVTLDPQKWEDFGPAP